ncbi:uncharacterized protein ACR2FA_010040 [Aphomia sociella]
MSKIENTKGIWSVNENINSKYEKCRNITEEIYKRINITFEIKKLETEVHSEIYSENSDQIDSNELSNETDLFACDKSDTISSSTEAERQHALAACEKYININNNEETKLKKPVMVYKRPRKRFRKRVKKNQPKPARSESDGSSDEALPLSRMLDVDTKSDDCKSESPDNVMGVPKIIIITKDMKPKIQKTDKPSIKESTPTRSEPETRSQADTSNDNPTIEKAGSIEASKEKVSDLKHCGLCSLSFRGERGLRRHQTMSHIISPEEMQLKKIDQGDTRH